MRSTSAAPSEDKRRACWAITASVVRGRGLATSRRADDVASLDRMLSCSLSPGSLNLVARTSLWLDSTKAIFRSPDGCCYWRGWLNDFPVLINRWSGCPAHIFEIFSDENLRSKLGLRDGVRVWLAGEENIVDSVRTRSMKHRVAWFLAWKGREAAFYRSPSYVRVVQDSIWTRRLWPANQ